MSASTMSVDYANSSDKLFQSRHTATKLRLLSGITVLLVLAVIGLIVALVVVSSNNKDNGSGDVKKGGQSGGQTGGLQVPDCPLNPASATPELDKANCILDSYPLVDG